MQKRYHFQYNQIKELLVFYTKILIHFTNFNGNNKNNVLL